jgi:hypothetical protein
LKESLEKLNIPRNFSQTIEGSPFSASTSGQSTPDRRVPTGLSDASYDQVSEPENSIHRTETSKSNGSFELVDAPKKMSEIDAIADSLSSLKLDPDKKAVEHEGVSNGPEPMSPAHTPEHHGADDEFDFGDISEADLHAFADEYEKSGGHEKASPATREPEGVSSDHTPAPQDNEAKAKTLAMSDEQFDDIMAKRRQFRERVAEYGNKVAARIDGVGAQIEALQSKFDRTSAYIATLDKDEELAKARADQRANRSEDADKNVSVKRGEFVEAVLSYGDKILERPDAAPAKDVSHENETAYQATQTAIAELAKAREPQQDRNDRVRTAVGR